MIFNICVSFSFLNFFRHLIGSASRRSPRWSSINDSMRFYRESILPPKCSDTLVMMAERLAKRGLCLMGTREAGFEFG